MRRALLPLTLVLLSGCVHRLSTGDDPNPAVVYVARAIHTLDPTQPIAEAIAVSRGQVLAVGSREEVLDEAGEGATVVELPGATIVPGLVDAHGHLASLGRALSVVSLEGTASVKEVLERLVKAPEGSYQGDWLVGRGWDQNDWPGAAFPTRAALDEKYPSKPVVLTRVDGHAVWANSEALRRAGVNAATRDPAGGRILRDASGEPTGVLVDNAIDLVASQLPPLTREQREDRLQRAIERCVSLGLTAVHDAGMSLADFSVLQQWDLAGGLPLRVYAMADGQGEDGVQFLERGAFRGRHLTMRAVKLVADGALGSRGAALLADYSDEPGHRGLLLLEPAALEEKARAFAAAGFQVAVHAIGDGANRVVIDLLAKLEKEHPGSRHRVEHAQVLDLDDLTKLGKAGVLASMQPTHATSDMPWAEARLGAKRLAGAYAWKSVRAAGAVLAFGSDFPVESPDPLLGLHAARTREDARGKPSGGWRPAEKLDGHQALEAFTVGGAFASFSEGERGRLVPGRQADLSVFSADPVSDPPAALLKAKALLTVVAGEPVYRARRTRVDVASSVHP
jgi:predicted amidohydrolase YtcJ